MKIDHILILAAGEGTRMGELGKIVPKVLWPIGDYSLLELQIILIRRILKETPIYINTFHYKDKIKEAYRNSDILQQATLIEEVGPLDIGGAIHNLAEELNYKGNLLILNSDLFTMFTDSFFEKINAVEENQNALLFTQEIEKSFGYNTLILDENSLKGIKIYEKGNTGRGVTYSGNSIINLTNLSPAKGKSKFFATVANYEERVIKCIDSSDLEYWDFGTFERYIDSLKKLIGSKSELNQFLCNELKMEIQSSDRLQFGKFSIDLLNSEIKII